MNGSTGSNLNGNNFDEFINDMGKYLNTNTKNNKPTKMQNDTQYEQTDNQLQYSGNTNINNTKINTNISNSVIGIDQPNLLDKEKLFQNFMLFMNSQQNTNLTETKEKIINKTDETHNINTKINSEKIHSKVDINFNNENKENTYYDNYEQEEYIQDNNTKNNIKNSNIHNDDEPIQRNKEENYNSSLLNIDDIPIKPKAKNFMELLEQNLANDNGDIYSNSNEYSKQKKFIEYKPRQRRSDMLHISQPSETKKYKYYSQNYDKEFGQRPEHEIEAEKFLQAQKELEEKNKNKNKGKFQQRGKDRNEVRAPLNKEKSSSNMIRGKSEARINNKTEVLKQSITPGNSKSNIGVSNNIWEDLKEVDKILGPNKEDDFLNLNSYNVAKTSNQTKENKIIPLKTQNIEIPDHINKLSTKEYTRFNESNSNSLNTSSINQNQGDYMRNFSEMNKNKIQKDSRELETHENSLNMPNLYSNDEYVIRMPIAKPNIIKTQTKVNPITEQVISMANNSKNQKNIENVHQNIRNIRSPNESMEKSIENDNKDDQDEESISDNQADDDDDNRDIIKIYENKYKCNQLNNNNNINPIKENQEDENNSNNFQNLYKKPEQQKIINKYFKPIINKENITNNNLNNKKSTIQNSSSNIASIDGELVNQKISELNNEIDKLKRENEKVGKLKVEYDRLTKKLNREVEEFSGKKEKEMEEFNKWKEEELKKIEKERKVYLRNTKLLQNMPNRKEREEIDNLKEQNLKLQEEMKAKDQRNKLAMDRLKKQLEEANKKNEDLQKEIKFMEEFRLKNMVSAAPIKNSQGNTTNNLASKKTPTGISTPNPNPRISSNNSTNNVQPNLASQQTLTTNKSLKNILINSGSSNKQTNIKYNPSNHNENIQDLKNDPVLVGGIKKQINANKNSDSNKIIIKDKNTNINSDYYSNYVIGDDKYYKFDDEPNQEDNDDLYEENENSQEEEYDTKIQDKEKIINYRNINENENKNDGNLEIKMNKVNVIKTSGNKSETPIKTVSNNHNIQGTQISTAKKPIYSDNNSNLRSNITTSTKQKINEDAEEDNYEMEFPEKYHCKSSKNVKLLRQDFTEDGKIIKIYENMKKEIIFPSGVKKETFEDGYTITYFNNKDIKQLYPDGKEVYLFFDNKTVQFKFPDGLHVFKFSTGQTEKHYPDGSKVLSYSDGTTTNVYPDGYQETFFPDGSLKKVDPSGVITFDYEDGMKVSNLYI